MRQPKKNPGKLWASGIKNEQHPQYVSEGGHSLDAVNGFSVRPSLRDLAVNDLFLAKAAIAAICPCRPIVRATESFENNSSEGQQP